MAVTEKEWQLYHQRAAEFEKTHPDFREKQTQAQKRAAEGSVDLPIAAAEEVVRLRSPETFYTILTDEREAASFHVAKGEYSNPGRDADKVRRLHSRLQRNQTFQTVTAPRDEVSEYLEKRREDFRSGKRRR